MTPASFPSASEVRSGMRRMSRAFDDVRVLQRAQIEQDRRFSAGDPRITVAARMEVMLALTEALGKLHESILLYLTLCGLAEDEDIDPVIDGRAVEHGR